MQLKNLVNDLIAEEKLLKGVASPKNLYHYTDAKGLLGIIKEQQFFATHSSFLNDKNEFEYGRNLLIQVLNDRAIDDIENQKIINNLILAIEKNVTNEYYITCFSGHKDDINQWIKYGKSGFGFCLEFKLDTLCDFFGAYADFLPVVYSKKAQVKILERLIDELFLCEIRNLSSENEYKDLFYQAFAEAFGIFSMFFKSDKFKSEKEYRAIMSRNDKFNIERELKFRINNKEQIVPYLEANHKIALSNDLTELFIDKGLLFKMKNVKIESIIIGPKQEEEKSKLSLLALQDTILKYSINIFKSQVPLD
nr:DUF2971 domain-containing protein [Pedobacter glucosidilyticus]